MLNQNEPTRYCAHVDYGDEVQVLAGTCNPKALAGGGLVHNLFRESLVHRANRFGGNSRAEQGAFKSITVYTPHLEGPAFVILDGGFSETEVTPTTSV